MNLWLLCLHPVSAGTAVDQGQACASNRCTPTASRSALPLRSLRPLLNPRHRDRSYLPQVGAKWQLPPDSGSPIAKFTTTLSTPSAKSSSRADGLRCEPRGALQGRRPPRCSTAPAECCPHRHLVGDDPQAIVDLDTLGAAGRYSQLRRGFLRQAPRNRPAGWRSDAYRPLRDAAGHRAALYLRHRRGR